MEETATDILCKQEMFQRTYTFFCYQEQQQPSPEPLSMDTGHKGFAIYTLTADISLTFWILHISTLQLLPSFYNH